MISRSITSRRNAFFSFHHPVIHHPPFNTDSHNTYVSSIELQDLIPIFRIWLHKQLPPIFKLKSSSLDADVPFAVWDGIMLYKCWTMKFHMQSFATLLNPGFLVLVSYLRVSNTDWFILILCDGYNENQPNQPNLDMRMIYYHEIWILNWEEITCPIFLYI